tara:strand:- start:3 stop:428 length:426 start_codon:yes stop_codon:yes gene_type:complete
LVIIRQNSSEVKKAMQIKLNNANSGVNKIIAYSDNWFKLSNKVIQTNLVISKNRICKNLLTNKYQDFTLQHLDKLILWEPEIIIIGSGKTLNFPNKEWGDYVNRKNIGFEVMDTGAACRSYNLLIDEDRNVIACLFLGKNA